MNLNDRLDRVRDEVADEVAADVRVPSFDGVLARRARRRRLRATAGGAALVVVVAGAVGGVAATRPGASRSVPPAATLSANPPTTPSTAPPSSASPTTVPSSAQTYPAKGSSYVVVPDGDQLAWTDLKTGAHGHFGPTSGQLSSPSVSTNGRRIAYLTNPENGIAVWDLDSRTAQEVVPPIDIENSPAISPDGTKVLWTEHTIIRMAEVGVPSSVQTVEGNGSPAAWVGNDAIAYLPNDTNNGGQCAVMRLELSAGHATRCLLPVATLQSVFASNGSTWQVDSVTGSGDTDKLALAVTTATPDKTGAMQAAIGILDPNAEATPFRVLRATVAADAGLETVSDPVLIDHGNRLVYTAHGGQENQGPLGEVVQEVDAATGNLTRVMTVAASGMGATSG